MRTFIQVIEFAVSLVVTLAALPLAILLARWLEIVDVPSARSSHTRPIYRDGGLACIFGVLTALLVAQVQGHVTVPWRMVVVVFALSLVGLLDDMVTIPVGPRLVAQLGAGGTLGWYVGHDAVWLLLGALVVAAIVNAVNFMDGIDGITGLSMAVWGLSAVLLAGSHHATLLLPIGSVTLGASVGFLPANLPRARLFLGDVGSYLFGGLVSLGLLVGWCEHVPVVALVAPLFVYLADTGLTLTRRALRRMPLLSAHREHVYQRLVSDCHLSHLVVAAYVAITSAAIGGCWLIASYWIALPISLALLLAYLFSPRLVRRVRAAGP